MPSTLDLTGLRCPIPVIRLEAAMRSMSPGETLRVLADDPVAKIDIPLAAHEALFTCAKAEDPPAGAFAFLVVAPVK